MGWLHLYLKVETQIKVTSNNFLTLTPGVRPFGENRGDQKRVADIQKAKEELVDFIVVGRPIYQDKNPAQKVDRILKEIKKVENQINSLTSLFPHLIKN